jgi:hypothetical protein
MRYQDGREVTSWSCLLNGELFVTSSFLRFFYNLFFFSIDLFFSLLVFFIFHNFLDYLVLQHICYNSSVIIVALFIVTLFLTFRLTSHHYAFVTKAQSLFIKSIRR